MINRRILVTGGAGFIGSHTVELLLEQGNDVVVLDNLTTGSVKNLPLHHRHLEFIEADVLEFPLIEELLEDCDAVLHLAAIASVPQSIEQPIYTFQVNTQGFLHVLEAVRRAKQPIRLVHASSAAVYGNATRLPCHEEDATSAYSLSPYSLQKMENERYAALYETLHGVSSLALRYFNVYGPRQDPSSPYSGVISRFIESYRQEKTLTVWGDGLQVRDFIHVSDIARANVLALNATCNGALNIATGKPETLLNLIKCIENSGGRSAEVRFSPARPGDIKASYADVQQAAEKLSFQASVCLENGIKTLFL